MASVRWQLLSIQVAGTVRVLSAFLVHSQGYGDWKMPGSILNVTITGPASWGNK
jgi:hypothetical protein